MSPGTPGTGDHGAERGRPHGRAAVSSRGRVSPSRMSRPTVYAYRDGGRRASPAGVAAREDRGEGREELLVGHLRVAAGVVVALERGLDQLAQHAALAVGERLAEAAQLAIELVHFLAAVLGEGAGHRIILREILGKCTGR